METLSRLLAAALVLTIFTTAGLAGEKRKQKEQEHHDTLIESVNASSLSIKEDKLSKTVPITRSTEIYVRGIKADIAALQPGMAVSITFAMDGVNVSRVNAGDPPVHREIKKVKPVRSLMK